MKSTLMIFAALLMGSLPAPNTKAAAAATGTLPACAAIDLSDVQSRRKKVAETSGAPLAQVHHVKLVNLASGNCAENADVGSVEGLTKATRQVSEMLNPAGGGKWILWAIDGQPTPAAKARMKLEDGNASAGH